MLAAPVAATMQQAAAAKARAQLMSTGKIKVAPGEVLVRPLGTGNQARPAVTDNTKAGQRQGSAATAPEATTSNASRRTAGGTPWYVYALAGAALIAAAQTLPRQWDGHIVYRGRVELPGLTQEQVMSRATKYASAHLFTHDMQVVPLLTHSACHLVSAMQGYYGQLPLRYEVVLHAEAGGCRYEVSDLATEHSTTSSAVVPGAGLRRPAARYELVEAVLDNRSNYEQQRRPRPHLRAYCATVTSEVEAVLAQRRAEMARP